METLDVVFASSESFAVGLSVAIRSLVEHARSKERIHLHVISSDLTEQSRDIVRRCASPAKLSFHPPRPVPSMDHANPLRFHPEILLRSGIPDLLPDCQRAVYLDADVLVVDDIEGLYRTELPSGCPLAAVVDSYLPWGPRNLRKLGFGARREYFNSGVLVMALDVLRREPFAQKFAECISSRVLLFPDQDALNLMFEHRWARLPGRWNIMTRPGSWEIDSAVQDEMYQARSNPGIIHFTGPKPWHAGESGLEYADTWLEYAREVGWPPSRLSDPRRILEHIAWLVAEFKRTHAEAECRAVLAEIEALASVLRAPA